MFVYIPLVYPRYSASLFAGNDFSRSSVAFAFIMFSRFMFIDLGIGKGVTVLAGLSVLGIVSVDYCPLIPCFRRPSAIHSFFFVVRQELTFTQLGMVALYFYGEKLRARSKFTENEGVEPSPNHEFNSTESQYKA